MINLCTYFDTNYLIKGLLCYETLMKYTNNFTLYVLALDEKVYEIMKNKKNVCVIKLIEIEKFCAQLLEIKSLRKLPHEYYTTITPILPQYIFKYFNINDVFYIDADMCFFSSAEKIKNVFNNYSIMVTEHENKEAYAAGRFNNGVMGFKNDKNALEFLEWYQTKCLEWCEFTWTIDGKCGDQGYLNIIYNEPNRFKNSLICPNCAINLGSWNIAMHKVEKKEQKILIDDNELVCYHFHRFNINGWPDKLNATGWKVSQNNIELIYKPYYHMWKEIEERYA